MKNFSKISTIVLVLLLLVSLLAACNTSQGGNENTDDTPKHVHTFEQSFSKDSEYHWHKATCEHVTEVSGKEKHKYNAGVLNDDGTEKVFTCTICQYTQNVKVKNDEVKATVKQPKIDISAFTVNIPEGTKYLGITTKKNGAKASADSDSPEVSQYLSAFSDFDELINKEITFSKIRKVFLKHEMIPTYIEMIETVVTDRPIYEMVEDTQTGEMIQKTDENGQPVQAKDENGNLLFETEEIVKIEIAGEEYKKLFSYAVDGDIKYAIHETVGGIVKYYAADADGNAILSDGERVQVTLPEEGADWQYVYEKDAQGNELYLRDSEGGYVFADEIDEDELDTKEKLVEVSIEELQDTFALDIIKLKVVNNFAFICFAIPIPDKCYSGGTYTIEEADGTITRFTAKNLPIRKNKNNADTYDSVDYYTNRFVQSYVLDTTTGKIYPLGNGSESYNLDEIDEFGMAMMGSKKYEIRLDEDNVNLTLRDISGNIVDYEGNSALAVYKDRNGIVYVKEPYENRVKTDIVHYDNINVTFVYYSVYFDCTYSSWKAPAFVFDYKNNAYSFIDGKLKMVIGYDEITNQLKYSDKDYSQTTERIRIRPLKEGTDYDDDVIEMYFLNGKLYSLTTICHLGIYLNGLHSYLICNVDGITEGSNITKAYIVFESQKEYAITGMIAYSIDNTYDDRIRKVFSYVYDDGIIFINSNLGELRIIYIKSKDFLSAEDMKTWKQVDSSIAKCYPLFGENIYYKDITFQCDGNIFDVNDGKTIQKIETPVIDYENNSILFKLIGNRTQYGTGVYYFSLDLKGGLPDIVFCYNTADEATIKREPPKDTSYIITISPIN